MKKIALTGGLVYSTEAGRMCPVCRRAIAACACARAIRPAGDRIVRVGRETGGRGGKTVTLVRGLAFEPAELVAFAKRLKATCGTGGTVKEGVIELQGDHRDALVVLLEKEGMRVKRVGG